jgi:osmotically-inducible protein OsmY
MKTKLSLLTAVIAVGLSSGLTFASPVSDQAQDQRENAVTAQLNQQQLQQSNGSYGGETYQGVETYRGIVQSPNQSSTQEQIAKPPSDDGDLSIIE